MVLATVQTKDKRFVLGDEVECAAELFIPVFIAPWMILIIDALSGYKILFRKLATKA